MGRNNTCTYHSFHSRSEVFEWVKEYYTQEELDEFDMNQHMDAPIADYKGQQSRYMNIAIRKGYTGTYELFDIEGLQNQLLSKHIPEDIVVGRYVDKKELRMIFMSTLFRREMEYRSFLSTTMIPELYSMNSIKRNRRLIKIYIPKGTPGMYLPEVNSEKPEFEILIPHGMRIKRIGFKEYMICL